MNLVVTVIVVAFATAKVSSSPFGFGGGGKGGFDFSGGSKGGQNSFPSAPGSNQMGNMKSGFGLGNMPNMGAYPPGGSSNMPNFPGMGDMFGSNKNGRGKGSKGSSSARGGGGGAGGMADMLGSLMGDGGMGDMMNSLMGGGGGGGGGMPDILGSLLGGGNGGGKEGGGMNEMVTNTLMSMGGDLLQDFLTYMPNWEDFEEDPVVTIYGMFEDLGLSAFLEDYDLKNKLNIVLKNKDLQAEAQKWMNHTMSYISANLTLGALGGETVDMNNLVEKTLAAVKGESVDIQESMDTLYKAFYDDMLANGKQWQAFKEKLPEDVTTPTKDEMRKLEQVHQTLAMVRRTGIIDDGNVTSSMGKDGTKVCICF